MRTTYAVASDYSEIVPTHDGFGKFATELEAVDYWIALLEGEREVTAERIARAKRRRRTLREAASKARADGGGNA